MRYPAGDAHEYHFAPKEAANVKAELIRRNLLSRKDLMQLYRPPLKKSQIPQNNPFTSKSLVDRKTVNSAALVKRMRNDSRGNLLPAIGAYNTASVVNQKRPVTNNWNLL